MKPTRRTSVSLVPATEMFLLMPSLLVKWCSTIKSAVFGLSSSLPPFVGGGGGGVCESFGKTDLLSDHFDGQQFRESVDLPLTCYPSPSLISFAFRLSEVRYLMLDFDPYRA